MKATWRITANERASAALRRLHEEATREAISLDQLAARAKADRTTRAALPALADLVKETEALGCHECGRSRIVAGKPCEAPLCRALAALRERLEARP